MLTSKWHTLNANCQKFNAAYKRAKCLGKSGKNDVNVLKWAQSIYRDEHKGVAFCQEDARAILKFHPKWDALEQVDLTGDVPGLPKRIYSVTKHDYELCLKREAAEMAFEAQAEKVRTLMRLEELRIEVRGSCNGLICLSEEEDNVITSLVMGHPLREECYEFPSPPMCFGKHMGRESCGLGFDTSTNTWKMVCVLLKEDAPPDKPDR
nr:hypothetical protein [Tanacetum cinerariifolium]